MRFTSIFQCGLLAIIAMMGMGCDDDVEIDRSPVELSASDIPISAGTSVEFTEFDPASLEDAVFSLFGGEFDFFTFDEVTTKGSPYNRAFSAFSDVNIPDANLSFPSVVGSTISSDVQLNYTAVRSLSTEGYFNVGRRYPTSTTVKIFDGAGEIEFLSGDFLYSEKNPIAIFPMKLGNTHETETVRAEEFQVTLASAGLNKTSATVIDSTKTTIKVDAWGEMYLPGYGEDRFFEVLCVIRSESMKRNYLLAGNPAPANLLASLGLVDGEESFVRYTDYYTPEHGLIVSYRREPDATGLLRVTSGAFRSDLK